MEKTDVNQTKKEVLAYALQRAKKNKQRKKLAKLLRKEIEQSITDAPQAEVKKYETT